MWFAPGSVIGLLTEMVIVRGPRAVWRDIASDPQLACISFLIYGVFCLLLSVLWRVPRYFWVGRYLAPWQVRFVSGVFVGGGGFGCVDLLQKKGLSVLLRLPVG